MNEQQRPAKDAVDEKIEELAEKEQREGVVDQQTAAAANAKRDKERK